MRVIIFGSRTWSDATTVRRRLEQLPADAVIVHGHCSSGADYIAERTWKARGGKTERHPANWDALGNRAGPIRNREMAELGADLAIGFRSPGKSNGTDNMREECERAGIPVEKHGVGWKP